jgi:hypothetical protein
MGGGCSGHVGDEKWTGTKFWMEILRERATWKKRRWVDNIKMHLRKKRDAGYGFDSSGSG